MSAARRRSVYFFCFVLFLCFLPLHWQTCLAAACCCQLFKSQNAQCVVLLTCGVCRSAAVAAKRGPQWNDCTMLQCLSTELQTQRLSVRPLLLPSSALGGSICVPDSLCH